jgi:cytochrome c biogenesis protein CcdA
LAGAFVLGILGGVLSSPCATPVLAAILAFVAGQGNIALGVGLLAVYSIGHCALLLVAGTSVGFVQKLAASPGTEKWGNIFKISFGILILILAFYLFYTGF